MSPWLLPGALPGDRPVELLLLLGALALVGCGAGVLPAIHSDAERLAVARQLKDRRDKLIESKDHKGVHTVRREMHKLKRQIRKIERETAKA